jgi:hypothetical protein
MCFLVEIKAEDGREDFQLIKSLTLAEDRYFRAFAAVTQQNAVKSEDGGFVRLVGCYLYEVSTDNIKVAKERVRNNEARRLHSSDDCMCGPPIIFENLFRTTH